MNRLLKAAAALLCAFGVSLVAPAQMTSVTAAAGSLKIGGSVISTGTVLLTPVNINGIAIAFETGGGGLNSPGAWSCAISAGGVTGCSVPDSALTTPANLIYKIQIADTSTGNPTSGMTYTLQAVVGVTGTTWALDHYGPPAQTTNVAMIQASGGPPNPTGACVSPAIYTNTSTGALFTCVGGAWVQVNGSGVVTPPATASSLGTVQLAAGQTATQLAKVATTGAYADLTGAPTGGSASPATATTLGIVQLAPGQTSTTLAKVATTGAYGDLTGQPTLGTAAAMSSTAFDAAGLAAAAQAASLQKANNLSDLPSASTARSNLGLGSAATMNSTAFDAAGAAAAAQTAAIAASLQKANNLSDLANAATARGSLGLGSVATKNTVGSNPGGVCPIPSTPIPAGDGVVADANGCPADMGVPPAAVGTLGQLPLSQGAGVGYAPKTIGGDETMTSNGVVTVTGLNGASIDGPVSPIPTVTPTANTNLLQYTGELTYWPVGSMTSVTGGQADELGTNTATLFVPNTVATFHTTGWPVYITAPAASTQPVTFSVWCSAATYGLDIHFTVNGAGNLDNYLNCTTGAVTTAASGVTITPVTASHGLYGFVFNYSIPAGGVLNRIYAAMDATPGGNINFAGNGTSGVVISHPYLQLGTTTTPTYQDVTSVHRYAQACYTSAGVTGGISQYVTSNVTETAFNNNIATEVNSIQLATCPAGSAYAKLYRTGGYTQGALLVGGNTQLTLGSTVTDNMLTADGTSPPSANLVATALNMLQDTRPQVTQTLSYFASLPFEQVLLFQGEPGLAGDITRIHISASVDENLTTITQACPGQTSWTASLGTFMLTQDFPMLLTTNKINVMATPPAPTITTGTTTSGSFVVTGVGTVPGNLSLGGGLTGTNIPPFSYVSAYTGSTITFVNASSTAATATGSITNLTLPGTQALATATGGYSSTIKVDIPFQNGCSVYLSTNRGNNYPTIFGDVWAKIGPWYTNANGRSYQFYEQPLTPVTSQQVISVLPTVTSATGGQLERVVMFGQPGAATFNPLEGNPTFTVDGDSTVVTNGWEDWAHGGYYFLYGSISQATDAAGDFIGWGLTAKQQPYDFLTWRNYDEPDGRSNVMFRKSLAITTQWGEIGTAAPAAGYFKSGVGYWTGSLVLPY